MEFPEYKLIEKKEKDIEIELKNKTIPNLIRKELINKGIDSYVYQPHPLLTGQRLHVHSENPIEDLINAIDSVNKNLIEFKNLINKELEKLENIEEKAKEEKPKEGTLQKKKRGRPRKNP
ncbi:MAG: hypothetical protein ACK4YO_01805 [Candidatus Altarchaeaceae archaeon]